MKKHAKIVPLPLAVNPFGNNETGSVNSEKSSIFDYDGDGSSEMKKEKASTEVGDQSYANIRSQLKQTIVNEVMQEVMPDIGAYDIDGVLTAPPAKKGLVVEILKFLGLWPLNLMELVLTGNRDDLARYMEKINTGKNPTPMLVNQYDETGQAPISVAVKLKREDLVTVLLRYHSLADLCDEKNGRSPLLYSVANKTINISKLLITAGASVNLADFQCVTPLMLACENKDMPHVKLLCRYDADMEAQDENGWTPLHYAAKSNSHAILRYFLEHGADRNIRDVKKRKAIHIARYCNNGESVSALEDMKSRIAHMMDEDD